MSKRSYEEIFAERNPRPYKGEKHHVAAERQSSGMRFCYDTEWYTEEEYKALQMPKFNPNMLPRWEY